MLIVVAVPFVESDMFLIKRLDLNQTVLKWMRESTDYIARSYEENKIYVKKECMTKMILSSTSNEVTRTKFIRRENLHHQLLNIIMHVKFVYITHLMNNCRAFILFVERRDFFEEHSSTGCTSYPLFHKSCRRESCVEKKKKGGLIILIEVLSRKDEVSSSYDLSQQVEDDFPDHKLPFAALLCFWVGLK